MSEKGVLFDTVVFDPLSEVTEMLYTILNPSVDDSAELSDSTPLPPEVSNSESEFSSRLIRSLETTTSTPVAS